MPATNIQQFFPKSQEYAKKSFFLTKALYFTTFVFRQSYSVYLRYGSSHK